MAPKKIIIIDDEPSVCDILKKLFTKEGYKVTAETDAEKGMDAVKKEKPDCLLLDIKMPKVDGIDLLAKIKKFDPSIIVIMITGYGTLESAMESMKLGAFDYITKPFDMDYIKSLVMKSLEK